MLSPVEFYKNPNISKGQKVATTAGAVVGAAAVASVVTAGILGKNTSESDKFIKKTAENIGAGYKKMGKAIAKFATETVWEKGIKKAAEWVKGVFKKAPETLEEVVETVEEAAQ